MNEPRTFASLSPTLLARKGSAKPAMRPQLAPLQQFNEATARQMDDLGWNDMGGEDENAASLVPQAEIVPLKGVSHDAPDTPPVEAEPAHVPPEKPVVLRQREAAAAGIARHDGPRRSALAEGRRAAFTLRLDAERHLRLRLACAVNNRSAQQIVTEALDALLDEMPEIAALAERARKRG